MKCLILLKEKLNIETNINKTETFTFSIIKKLSFNSIWQCIFFRNFVYVHVSWNFSFVSEKHMIYTLAAEKVHMFFTKLCYHFVFFAGTCKNIDLNHL